MFKSFKRKSMVLGLKTSIKGKQKYWAYTMALNLVFFSFTFLM